MEDALYRGNREPTLDHILAEPIVRTIMRRDGVDEETIRCLMRQAARIAQPPEALKLRLMPPMPPASEDDTKPPQASIGVLAQAAAEPRWPRVFPSL